MRHIRDARVLSGWGIPGVALAFKERWAAWKKSGLVPECYQISCGVCSGGDAIASVTTGPLSELPAEKTHLHNPVNAGCRFFFCCFFYLCSATCLFSSFSKDTLVN